MTATLRRALASTWALRGVLGAQAFYYVITGLWPLISMRTFLRITGPKTDLWLVKTVGVLIAVIGAVLGLAALRSPRRPEHSLLAIGSALGLTAVDVVYVSRRRIAKVYLLDALAELMLALPLIAGWVLRRRR